MNRNQSYRFTCTRLFRGICSLGAALGLFALAGCTSPLPKPQLSAETQAEALSCFSLGLLAESNGNSEAALAHFEQAVELDPNEPALYGPAIAVALKVDQKETALKWAELLNKRHPDLLDSQLLLANVYALNGKPFKAEFLFRQAVNAHSENPTAHIYLTRFYLARENREAALQVLENALEKLPDDSELQQLLGILYIDQTRHEKEENRRSLLLKGANLLRKSLDSDPENPERWQQLGQALLLAEQPEQALEAFREALKKDPSDLFTARQVLDLTIQTQPFQDALNLCYQLAEQTEIEAEAWVQFLADRLPDSEKELLTKHLEEKIGQLSPVPVFYYTQLISLYLNQERDNDAEALLSDALKLYPEETRLKTVMGYLNLKKEEFEAAYDYLEQVRQESAKEEWSSNPFFLYHFLVASQKSGHLNQAADILSATHTNNPAVLNQYMSTLLTGDSPIEVSSAIQLLDRFHAKTPNVSEVLYYLAILQSEQKDYVGALKNARQFEEEALQQGHTNLLTASFYYQYAMLHERNGLYEDAEPLFYKTIELGDETLAASARNYIAYMWAERGEKLDTALELVQEALKSEPDNGAFIDTLGWVYYMQGRYAKALHTLQRALEVMDSDPTVWEHLGDTYFKLGNRQAAIEHWKKSLELEPDAPALLNRLKEIGISVTNGPAPEHAPADKPPRP